MMIESRKIPTQERITREARKLMKEDASLTLSAAQQRIIAQYGYPSAFELQQAREQRTALPSEPQQPQEQRLELPSVRKVLTALKAWREIDGPGWALERVDTTAVLYDSRTFAIFRLKVGQRVLPVLMLRDAARDRDAALVSERIIRQAREAIGEYFADDARRVLEVYDLIDGGEDGLGYYHEPMRWGKFSELRSAVTAFLSASQDSDRGPAARL